MPSPDRRHWIVFNGEIFNYVELRKELQSAGHRFVSGTDTEVALAAYVQWGTACFERFNGMWGIAIVDLRRRVLILSRDRLGIKPLYVAASGSALFFASEIKQLLATSRIEPIANTRALVEYVDTGYQAEPATMFAGVEAFEPGCWSETPLDRPGRPAPQRFWSPSLTPRRFRNSATAAEELRELFEDAVRLHLRADVRVGVALSGGLDSSALYGQARRSANGAHVDAFCAAFDDEQLDERPYIKQVIERHGGRAHMTFPGPEQFLADCDRFVYHHDEPVASLSQYAAWSVMRRAREERTPVLLLGQGGDELFSGYWPAYYMFLRQRPRLLPSHMLGALLPGGNPSLITQLFPHLRQYYNRRRRQNREVLTPAWRGLEGTRAANWAWEAQRLDPVAYRWAEIRDIHLPRLLKWDDRSAMAFGIEGRYPLLDHRLVEFALSIPPAMNLHRGWNKMVLRQALGDVLPPSIQWRRSKNGFVTPQAAWLRTTMRPLLSAWVERPSAMLCEIVDREHLATLAQQVFHANLHPMDERQLLLLRLFLLDRWLNCFSVSGASAPNVDDASQISRAAGNDSHAVSSRVVPVTF